VDPRTSLSKSLSLLLFVSFFFPPAAVPSGRARRREETPFPHAAGAPRRGDCRHARAGLAMLQSSLQKLIWKCGRQACRTACVCAYKTADVSQARGTRNQRSNAQANQCPDKPSRVRHAPRTPGVPTAGRQAKNGRELPVQRSGAHCRRAPFSPAEGGAPAPAAVCAERQTSAAARQPERRLAPAVFLPARHIARRAQASYQIGGVCGSSSMQDLPALNRGAVQGRKARCGAGSGRQGRQTGGSCTGE